MPLANASAPASRPCNRRSPSVGVPARASSQALVTWNPGLSARAQQPTLRFAAVFSDRDIRARMIEMFAKEVAADFKIEPFYNGSLFKQGPERQYGYYVLVPRDGVADRARDAHDASLLDIDAKYGDVVTIDEAIETISASVAVGRGQA